MNNKSHIKVYKIEKKEKRENISSKNIVAFRLPQNKIPNIHPVRVGIYVDDLFLNLPMNATLLNYASDLLRNDKGKSSG